MSEFRYNRAPSLISTNLSLVDRKKSLVDRKKEFKLK